ncbi:MAG: protein phosphatase 2C domain-containing protein [Trichlorobacter sp.]|uniref:PP2C family protein-serine/threonine phosphatase n=1 Tax=Trichlorobacter sp. TaxID=2911007 RepID=UPI00256B1FA7|nr:protein phosphatase 2C domain-containing protein [Trichlorobacter sp.]MDK9718654.1 protein phosphatase 2C domain-containing protein [Trichlorobacter sp.]
MNNTAINEIQISLYRWFMRRTTSSAVRKIGEIPISVGSDIGAVRNENQDRVAVLKMPSFIVAVLCDGMGGMSDGTACAAKAAASFLATCVAYQNTHAVMRLQLAAQIANDSVFSQHRGQGGATLSAILFDHSGIFGVNVGDSRIYAIGEGKLEQLSTDDTMNGVLQRADNNPHPRNELIQFIGMGGGIEPHIFSIRESYDCMMLTSDGVHYIDKQVMKSIVQHAKESALAVRRLIEVAKWCGGRDNASLAIASPSVLQAQLFDETGVVQIWDPFGELQIINAEISGNVQAEPRQSLDKKTVVQKVVEQIAHPDKLLKKKRPTKKKTAEKVVPKVADANTDTVDTESEQPPLKIFFKGNMDKDDKHV